MSDELTTQAQGEGFDLDDIVGSGTFVKEGRYAMRLVASNPVAESKTSKKPMVVAVLEVEGGEFDGTDVNKYFTMHVSPPNEKTGKRFAPGIADLKATLANCGQPLPAGYSFPRKGEHGDPIKASQLLGRALNGKKLEVAIVKEAVKDKETKAQAVDPETGKPKWRYTPKILGLFKADSQSSDSGSIEDVL